MTDLSPTLAALFMTLLGTADAATRAALISALQDHSPPLATNTTDTLMILALIGQIPEVLRTDRRAKHHLVLA
jgi:hypothetical protein